MSSIIDEQIVVMKFDARQFEAGVRTTQTSLEGLKKSLNLDSAKAGLDKLMQSSKNFTMKFNNKEFEAGAQKVKTTSDTTITKLGDLDRAGKNISLKPNMGAFQSGMSNALTHMQGAINKLGDLDLASKRVTLNELSSNVDRVSGKFSAMSVAGIAAMAALGAKAAIIGVQMAKQLAIDPAKMGLQEYETNLGSIQTIMSNTQWENKSLGDVNGALDELNTYSDKTIYNFAEMAKNIGTFTAAGVSLDDSTAAIKGIANLAAVSGSNSEQASSAMYQLSQAMSAGKVGLEDWNSVVNSGMGGKVFQDALMETARNQGQNVDGLIAKHGSFRQSLQEGWITTKVMNETLAKMTGDLTDQQLRAMGYNDEQIVGIQKMAKNAQDAATKIKTFSQLTNTLSEGTTSGWATSWKLILGDFEQAKAMWSSAYKVLGAMVEASANARNKMLGDWNKLGGRTALIETVANAFKILMNVIKPFKEAFREVFPAMTGKRLFDITVALRNFTRFLLGATDNLNPLKQSMKFFFSILKLGLTIVTGILKVFGAFFGALFSGGESVNKTGEAIGKFFENLNKALANFSFIDKFFKMVGDGARHLGDLVRSAFSTIGSALSVLAIYLEIFFIKADSFLYVTGKNFEVLSLVIQTKLIPVFYAVKGAIQAGLSTIRGFLDVLRDVGEAILEGGWEKGVEAFQDGMKELSFITKQSFKALSKTSQEALSGFAEGVVDTWQLITTRVRERIESIERFGRRISDMAQRVWTALEPIRTAIADLFGEIGRNIQEVFADVNYDDTLDMVNTVLLGGIAFLFNKFVKGGLGFGDDLKESLMGNLDKMFEGVTGALEGLTGTLEAMQKNLQADTLMKIALAIGILTASIVVLSLIDSKALTKSLIAITVMFGLLAGALTVFEKVASGPAVLKMPVLAAGLILLGIAINVLASAVKKLSTLSWGELIKGLVGVTVLLNAVARAASLMSKNAANLIATGIGMIAIAIAIKILASAVKDFADISFGNMIKGLIGVSAMLGALALFTQYAKVNKGAIGSGIGLILLATALKIMASAMVDFAAMNVGALIQGVAALGAVLFILAKFTNAVGDVTNIFKMAASMVVLGLALKILASAINDMGSMPVDVLAKGLITMSIALKAITQAMRAMPPNMLANAVGMVAIAGAMLLLSVALKSMGGMSWEEIAKGLVTLSISLGVMAVAANAMTGALPGAAAILVVAAALNLLVPVLQALGAMTWEELLHGLAGLAAVFLLLGIAGFALGFLAPVILSLGISIAMLGVGMLSMGMGMLAFSTGLALMAAIGAAAVPVIVLLVGAILALIPIAMIELGKGVVAFADVIGNAAPTFVAAAVKLMLAVLRGLDEVIPRVGKTIGLLITTLLNLLLRSVPEFVDKGMRIVLGILNGIANNIGKVVTAAANIIVNFLNGIANNLPRIIAAGANLIIRFIQGIGQQIGPLLQAGADLIIRFVEGLATTIRNNQGRMNTAGSDLAGAIVEGMVNGIGAGIQGVIDAAVNLGKNALEGAKKILGIASPSKRFFEVGEWSGEGMANGLTSMSGVVAKASEGVGNTALTSLRKSISGIATAVAMDNINMNPTIRPVLDLSAIQKDSQRLNGMITPPTLALTGTYNKATTLSNATMANQETAVSKTTAVPATGDTLNFTQINNSPKALSRSEIYRQTNNQISVAKGALTKK
jgi:tape measure domain-containing protein